MLISRYIEISVFKAVALVAGALGTLFSLLEFVEQLASVGHGRYRVIDALDYVLLTAPSRLLQVTPVSVLLGCLLALGGLAHNLELTAMQSLGMSRRRIIGAVLRLTLPIIIVILFMMELAIPPAQQLAQEQRSSALSPSTSSHSDKSYWAQKDRQFLNVQRFEHGKVPVGIDVYAFNTDGSLQSILHADRADIRQDGTWLLKNVSKRHTDSSQLTTETFATLAWPSFLARQDIQFLVLPPTDIAPLALFHHIRMLAKHHQNTTRYKQALWAKISVPLSIVAMALSTAPFVFGLPRTQGRGDNLARGVGFGITFSLGQQILARVGLLLNFSPVITATALPLLVIVLALYLLRSGENRAR